MTTSTLQHDDTIHDAPTTRVLSWTADRHALARLLDELFPDGLTDDCPARQGQLTAPR